jgi:hypothetical protein
MNRASAASTVSLELAFTTASEMNERTIMIKPVSISIAVNF